MTVAVLVEGLTVEFGRFRAIDDLSLAIDYGEVRAVIGPNGAGKTTLLDVVSGVSRAKAGRILFDERLELTRRSEAAIARAGVRRKFQKPSVFEALSVRDNVEIGLGGASDTGSKEKVAAILETVGLSDHADRPASELAHGQKQWLEIAMVVV
ncbi:MAG: ATP-binding cassette domain-containing protein, partial [Hansschlegelia sp.]